MEHIAISQIHSRFKEAQSLTDDELNTKINLLYKQGYIYDPYYQQFHNPFIGHTLKPNIVWNTSSEVIGKTKEFKLEIDKSVKSKTIDEVEVYFQSLRNPILELVEEIGGIVGMILILISIVCYFLLPLIISVCLAIIGSWLFSAYNYGSIQNEAVEGISYSSEHWRKWRSFYVIMNYINYFLVGFFIFRLISGIFMGVALAVLLTYFIDKTALIFSIRRQSILYWNSIGLMNISAYNVG